MIRVCAPKGYVVVFDAVLPIRWWLRPLAAAICRGDRGKFIRSQTTIKSLLPKRSLWSIERKLYNLLAWK